ncbi:MAG: STAS domain-containing protein [Emcibacter sp.]|nr:STAS domain-containing protein [Emcibacter sp.]
MKYQIDVQDDKCEAKLSEKITFSDLNGFREIIKQMLDSHAENNIVDFSDVDFIDSAGLGMLLLTRNEIAKTDSRLTLKAPQGQVQRMFNVARFDRMFHIEEGPRK